MSKISAITEYRLTAHAQLEIKRRNITNAEISQVLSSPEQIERTQFGRIVYQSKLKLKNKIYLLRVFVDIDKQPPEIVTAYRTSKIKKYWS